jgi:alpha-beta hydrolase superfamily lysophospholipase
MATVPAPAPQPGSDPVEERIYGGIGEEILVRTWRPSSAARGILVICHGLKSHSGYYGWTASQLAGEGLVVYALDLHGRGKSAGDRYFAYEVDEYLRDVDAVVTLAQARHPGLPTFLLGHSAGGVVAAAYALEYHARLAGLISESLAFQVAAPDFALAVIKGISHVAPHLHVLRLRNEDFSRDPEVVKRMNEDPLIKDEVEPAQTVAALVRADERLKAEFPELTLPVLILHGTADKVTNPAGSRYFFEHTGSPDKTLKLYEGHVLDLLNDVGKEGVMADIVDWLRPRLAQPDART